METLVINVILSRVLTLILKLNVQCFLNTCLDALNVLDYISQTAPFQAKLVFASAHWKASAVSYLLFLA